MSVTSRAFGFGCLLLLLLAAAAPAAAQVSEGSGHLEFYGGYHVPNDDQIDEDVTFGIRAGYNVTRQLGIEGSVGRVATTWQVWELDPSGAPVEVSYDFDMTFVDVAAVYHSDRPKRRSQLTAAAGIGWAINDLDDGAIASLGGEPDRAKDSLTAHVSVGGKFFATNIVYFKPDARARWFRESGDIDFDATVGIGVLFVGR